MFAPVLICFHDGLVHNLLELLILLSSALRDTLDNLEDHLQIIPNHHLQNEK